MEARITVLELNGIPRTSQPVPQVDSLEFNGNPRAPQPVSQVESQQTDADGGDSGTDAAGGASWATVTRRRRPVQSHSPTPQPACSGSKETK